MSGLSDLNCGFQGRKELNNVSINVSIIKEVFKETG